MTFLAGDTIDTARSQPTVADLNDQERDGTYWWAAYPWWIRCDLCGRTTPYHLPAQLLHSDDVLAWKCGWISWETDHRGGHHCADGCQPQHVQLDLLAAIS